MTQQSETLEKALTGIRGFDEMTGGDVLMGTVVTPTLLKLAPQPLLRIIGDLSNGERVLGMLGHYQGEQ